jgi:osmotically-inducible protein OsmY
MRNSENKWINTSVLKAIFVLGLVCLPLTGCVGVVVGAGASAGVAALEERTAKTIAKDTAMAAKIRLNLVNANEKLMTGIGVEVYEARVMMTGIVPTEELRAEAIQLAWKVEQVGDVLNEIQVADTGIVDFAKDSWITTQLTSKLTFDRDVQAINYNIETVNGIVYMIGLAQNQKELDRVIGYAREIGGVQRIINHVGIKKAAS